MAHGGASTSSTITLTGGPHNFYCLRPDSTDFPDKNWKPIRLLHLHGSVTFWKIDNSWVKVEIPTTRNPSVWNSYREGTLEAQPLIVLANQHDKADHVRRYPHNVAYEVAEDDFRSSAHWLIVGYSFRDTCVNELLKRCWRSWSTKPRILVVTKGSDPADSVIEATFGLEAGKLSEFDIKIERDGIADLGDTTGWKWFVGEEPPF